MKKFKCTNFLLILAGFFMLSIPATKTMAMRDAGPGGPILVITGTTNLFSDYYAVILKSEGFNEFKAIDISQVDSSTLNNYDIAILGEISLTTSQVTMLIAWVAGGGHLIAMRPDQKLLTLFGISAGGTLSAESGYLLIDTSKIPGKGIYNQTMQIHGVTDLYNLGSATSLAKVYNKTTLTSNPAVAIKSVGSNGGSAAVFAFDLARSIVYFRQGNPAYNDVIVYSPGYHIPLDLYSTNHNEFPHWLDQNKVMIPQVDEQIRFLTNLIYYMNSDKKPLPRFWFLPKGLKAAIVMTGDDHHNARTWKVDTRSPGEYCGKFFSLLKAFDPPGASLDDWECFRGTSYGYVGGQLTTAQAKDYSNQGFDYFLHPDSKLNTSEWAGDWASDYASQYTSQYNDFIAKYSGYPIVSSRNHGYAWVGYVNFAKEEERHGIRYDVNFTYWNFFESARRYIQGSIIPMNFAMVNNSGVMTELLNVYNAGTQLDDDRHWEDATILGNTCNAFLDAAIGPLGYYGILTTNCHSDNTFGWSYDMLNSICQSAKSRGIPVVSASQMVTWLDGRNSSSISSITWDGSVLGFTINPGVGSRNLRSMLPTSFGSKTLSSIMTNGNSVSFTKEHIKGMEYAFFAANSGAYTATYLVQGSAISPKNVRTGVPARNATVSVFNGSGVLVVQKVLTNDNMLDISSLVGGLYVIRIKKADAVNTSAFVRKIIIPSGHTLEKMRIIF